MAFFWEGENEGKRKRSKKGRKKKGGSEKYIPMRTFPSSLSAEKETPGQVESLVMWWFFKARVASNTVTSLITVCAP